MEANPQDPIAVSGENYKVDIDSVETNPENLNNDAYGIDQFLDGFETATNTFTEECNPNSISLDYEEEEDDKNLLDSQFNTLPFHGSEVLMGMIPHFDFHEEELKAPYVPSSEMSEKLMNEGEEVEGTKYFDGNIYGDDINYYNQDQPEDVGEHKDDVVRVDTQVKNSEHNEGENNQLLGNSENGLNSISVKENQKDFLVGGLPPFVVDNELNNLCAPTEQKLIDERQEVEEKIDFEGDIYGDGVNYYNQDQLEIGEERKDDGAQVDTQMENSQDNEGEKHQLLGSSESELNSIIAENGDSAPCVNDDNKQSQLLSRPPHGSEIFIGGLPRFLLEEELENFCESAGQVYEVNVMVNKESGECKGYAFVSFNSRETAQRAVEELHNKEFKGKTLRCSLHESKYRLFIKNIPKTWSDDDFRRAVEEVGPGVAGIDLLKEPLDPTCNRGFAFVEYYNSSCADYSKEKMMDAAFTFDGNIPSISWADPKVTVDHSTTSQVKALYVKNIPRSASIEELRELFEHYGEVTSVVLPNLRSTHSSNGDIGFVNFAERSSALKAVRDGEHVIHGRVLGVSLAKPQSDRKYEGVGGGHGNVPCSFQQVTRGRGANPAVMNMVQVMLPDGRMGYVLQQSSQERSPPWHRGWHNHSWSRSRSGSRSRSRSWSRSRSRSKSGDGERSRSRGRVRRSRYRDEDVFHRHGPHRRHRPY